MPTQIRKKTYDELLAENDRFRAMAEVSRHEIIGLHKDVASLSSELEEARTTIQRREAVIKMLESDIEAIGAGGVSGKRRTPPSEPFAIVIDRIYDGEGPSLAYWNGENYQFSDGDCFNREGETLDGYTAEFLTDHQLEERLFSDRKRQGEVVVTKTPEGEIIAVTRQDNEGKILSVIAEADRKRRGEPVYLLFTEEGTAWTETNEPTYLWWKSQGTRPVRILYTAPQLAEPLMQEKISVDKSTYGWPTFKDACYQSAEPVKVQSVDPIKYDDTRDDMYVTGWNDCLAAIAASGDHFADVSNMVGPAEVPAAPDTIYLGCARMGMAGASDEEVMSYVRAAKESAVQEPPRSD